MNRASALALALAALTTGCVDDLGGAPLGEEPAAVAVCVGGICLGAGTVDAMAQRAAQLETCAPLLDNFAPQLPDDLRVGGITLIELDGGPALEVELLNLNPRGFYQYPGLMVEVLAGDMQVGGRFNAPPARQYIEQYYGITGCGQMRITVPLVPGGVEGPITVRASATVLHQPVADEWAFVLTPDAG